MAAALSSHPDLSLSPQHEHDSNSNSLTNPDFTLGSLTSGLSTPNRPGLRVPSASSRTTATSSIPVQTPSPPAGSNYVSSYSNRKHGSNNTFHLDEDGLDDYGANETGNGDLLGTPGASKGFVKARGRSGTLTSGSGPSAAASGSKLSKLTLRDQEKVRIIDRIG